MNFDRRGILKSGLGAAAFCLLPKIFAQTNPATEADAGRPSPGPGLSGPLITKAIPSSGERLSVLGIGTNHFDHATPQQEAELKEVVRLLPILGGKTIDTAEGYGEPLVGKLVSELGNRDQVFFATKVGVRNGAGKAAGLSQIERSFRRLRTKRIDLIAVHSLGDTETQLATLRDLKQAGRIRYLGVTTSSASQHDELEAVMKAQSLDSIQVDYAIDNRGAADRILPLAQDRGMAVMTNLPLGRGRVFGMVQGKPLPDWTAEFDCGSWADFFLKYIVSHPAVTCAIPGTTRVKHLRENAQAAHGRLPDAAMRSRMEKYIDTL